MKFCPNLVDCFNQSAAKKTAQQMVVVWLEKIFGKKATVQYRFLNPNMVISQI
jgi:hypothetical protein